MVPTSNSTTTSSQSTQRTLSDLSSSFGSGMSLTLYGIAVSGGVGGGGGGGGGTSRCPWRFAMASSPEETGGPRGSSVVLPFGETGRECTCASPVLPLVGSGRECACASPVLPPLVVSGRESAGSSPAPLSPCSATGGPRDGRESMMR